MEIQVRCWEKFISWKGGQVLEGAAPGGVHEPFRCCTEGPVLVGNSDGGQVGLMSLEVFSNLCGTLIAWLRLEKATVWAVGESVQTEEKTDSSWAVPADTGQ